MAAFLFELFCLFSCTLAHGWEGACASDSLHASEAEETTFLHVSQGQQVKSKGASNLSPWCWQLPCETAQVICRAGGQCCDLAKSCKPAPVGPVLPAAMSCYSISCRTAKKYCQDGRPHGRCCDHAHTCRDEAPKKPPASLVTAVTPTALMNTGLAGSQSRSKNPALGILAVFASLVDYNYFIQIKDYSILTNVGNSFSHSFPGFIQNWDAVVSDNGKYGMLINDCDIYGVIFGDDGFGNNYDKMDVAFKSTACYFETKYSGEICAYNSSVHFETGDCDTVWLEAGEVDSPVLKMEDTGVLCTYDMYNNEVECSKTFEELHEIMNFETKQDMTALVMDAAAAA